MVGRARRLYGARHVRRRDGHAAIPRPRWRDVGRDGHGYDAHRGRRRGVRLPARAGARCDQRRSAERHVRASGAGAMSGLTRSLVLGGSGADYLGPQTMAQLQAGAYADGTPALAALAKDTVVYDPDGLCSYVPNAAGTAWTVGRAGQEVSIADLATRMSLGRPVPAGVQLIDPTTKQVYGQSDGAGGYSGLNATFSQVTTGIVADGNTATLVKPAGVSRCAVSVTGSVDYAA